MNDTVVVDKEKAQYELLNIQYRFTHPKLHNTVDFLLRKLPDTVWEDLLYRQVHNPAMLDLLLDAPFMSHVILVTRSNTLMSLRDEFKTRLIKLRWQKENVVDLIDKIDDEYSKWGGLSKKTHQELKDTQFLPLKIFHNPLMAGHFAEFLSMLFYITFKHYPGDDRVKGFY